MNPGSGAISNRRMWASRRLLRLWSVAFLLFLGTLNAAHAELIEGSLVFTRYKGAPNVQRVNYRFDGASLTVGRAVAIATTEGANGIIVLPDGDYLVGGQADRVHKVTEDGEVTSFEAGGTAAHHLTLDPSGTKAWAGGAPGTPAEIPLAPFGVGQLRPLSGDDTEITQIIFDDRGRAFYTSGAFDGWGNFGRIDMASLRTTRLLSGLEAAHGMTFDPFSGDLILFGGNMIAQIDPDNPTVVKSTAYYSLDSQFDVGRTDGKGHLFATRNDGYLVFVDFDNTRLVGAKENVVRIVYVDSYIDDLVMVPLAEDEDAAEGAPPPAGAEETPSLADQSGDPARPAPTPGGMDGAGDDLARAGAPPAGADTGAAENAAPPGAAETVASAAMTAAAAVTLMAALGLALSALPRAPARAGTLAAADGFMAAAAGIATANALADGGAAGMDLETGVLALASAAALLAATAKLASAMPGSPAPPEEILAMAGLGAPAMAALGAGGGSPAAFTGGDGGNVSSRDFTGQSSSGSGDVRGHAGQGGGAQPPSAPPADAGGATAIADGTAQTIAEQVGWNAPLTALAARLPKKSRNPAAPDASAMPSQIDETAESAQITHDLEAGSNPPDHVKGPLAAAGGVIMGAFARFRRPVSPARKTPARGNPERPRKRAAPEPDENRLTYLSMTVEEIVAGLRAAAPAQDVALTIEPNVTAQGPLEAIRPAMRAMLSHAWARTGGVSSARVVFGVETRDGAPAYFVSDNGAAMAEGGVWPESDEARGGRARLDAAQKIVERHGGRLWAETRAGGDTALFLSFSPSSS